MIWNIFRRKPAAPRPPRPEAAPRAQPPAPPRKPSPAPQPAAPSPILAALQGLAGQGPNPPVQALQTICEFWLKEKLAERQPLLDALLRVAPRTRHAFLGHLLADEKVLSEDKVIYTLSRLYRIPCYNIAQYDINPKALAAVRGDVARSLHVFPVDCMGRILTLAVANPFINLAPLQLPKGLSVRKVLCRRDTLQTHLDIYYPPEPAAADGAFDALFAQWRQSARNAPQRIPPEEIEFHLRGNP